MNLWYWLQRLWPKLARHVLTFCVPEIEIFSKKAYHQNSSMLFGFLVINISVGCFWNKILVFSYLFFIRNFLLLLQSFQILAANVSALVFFKIPFLNVQQNLTEINGHVLRYYVLCSLIIIIFNRKLLFDLQINLLSKMSSLDDNETSETEQSLEAGLLKVN